MNILIVGNGFDIAHDLPTTYLDFIKFMNVVKVISEAAKNDDFEFFEYRKIIYKQNNIDTRIAKYLDNLFVSALIDPDSYCLEEFVSSNPLSALSKLVNFSKDNIWLEYFSCKIDIEKNYWAGFEEDISVIVQEIDKLKSKSINYSLDIQSEFSENMSIFLKNISIKNDFFSSIAYKDFKKRIIRELNDLIECFEIYIDDCINKMIIFRYSPCLHEITINKVLSFNYSNTFERCSFYQNNEYEICYIHGKASTDSKKNNMVLGIDEYLSDEEKNINIEFVELKKFFQRIHKRTGCEYKKWISEINGQQKETENNVYIWGHSLSITDKDILREFLLCKNTKITIFYHDDKQFKQQIANLIPVLGHDKLIEMTYEYSPKLIFLEQREMCNKGKLGYDIKEETSNFKKIGEIIDDHEKKMYEKYRI